MFLRMVARPLMAKVTYTTGIKKVPEDAVWNSREILVGLYSQIFNEMKKLPNIIYRQHIEADLYYKIEFLRKEEISGEIIEEARRELSEISDLVAGWQPYMAPPLSTEKTGSVSLNGKLSEKEQLMQLYYDALDVVRNGLENNEVRMFAESSITRKLKVCQEEDNWESIKSKLDYEDPIQKAREELDYWSHIFGPDADPNREYPFVPLTKEFCERFDAWRELACSTDQLGKATLAVI